MRPELNDDFVDMLHAMREARVEYVVVGAHALAALGVVRATGDIDLLVRPTEDNADRVFRALLAFGAPVDAHGIAAADFARPDNVYQIGLPPRRIDILTSISGVPFEDAWATRVPTRFGSIDVCVLGREAMIRNKRSTGRPKDLIDVEALESLG